MSRREVLRGAAGVAGLTTFGSLLAGCGSDGDPSRASSGAAVSGAINVLRWDPIGGISVALDESTSRFAADYPGASVKIQTAPITTYSAALTSQIRSNTLPDLVMLLAAQTNRQAWPAVTTIERSDVGDLVDKLTGWDSAAIVPGAADSYFGIPLGTTGALWYYNKTAYEKAGLDPDSPPTKWEELADNCERLKASGIEPLGMGAKDNYTAFFLWQTLLPQFYTAEQVVEFATGELNADDEGMAASLAVVRDTYEQGWWQSGWAGKAATDVQNDFMNGKVAHVTGIVTGLLDWATFDTQMQNGTYGAFAAPVLPQAPAGERRMHAGCVEVLSISKRSENAETARAYAEFLASPDLQRVLLQEGGQLPNHRDVSAEGLITSRGGLEVAELHATLPQTSSPLNQIKAAALAIVQQKLAVAVSKDQGADLLSQVAEAQARA